MKHARWQYSGHQARWQEHRGEKRLVPSPTQIIPNIKDVQDPNHHCAPSWCVYIMIEWSQFLCHREAKSSSAFITSLYEFSCGALAREERTYTLQARDGTRPSFQYKPKVLATTMQDVQHARIWNCMGHVHLTRLCCFCRRCEIILLQIVFFCGTGSPVLGSKSLKYEIMRSTWNLSVMLKPNSVPWSVNQWPQLCASLAVSAKLKQ